MAKQQVLTVFGADTKDLEKGVKTVDKKVQGLSSAITKAFQTTAVAVGAVTTAIGALVKKSVEAYAEFEQLEGGLEAMFGKGSKEMQRVMKMSEEAYFNLTMSQNDYLDAFERTLPLIKGGLSKNADAIDYTNKALQVSADLFNTFGKSTEYYQNAIDWAMKGVFSYVDNLNIGILGTAEGFVDAANKSGLLKRNIEDVKELTNDEILDIIVHYTKATGAWGRTQEEASKTIMGSLNMTKATWQNFVAGLSKKDANLDKLIEQLVFSIQKVVENVTPVLMRALENFAKVLPDLVQVISAELPTLVNSIIPPLIQSIEAVIVALTQALPDLLKTILPILIDTFITIINTFVQVLPEILPILMDGLITLINAIVDNAPIILQALIDMIPVIALGFAEALPTLIPTIVEGIIKLMEVFNDNMPLFLEAGLQIILGIIKGIINSIPLILENLPTIIEFIINFFTIEKLLSAGKTLIMSLGKGLAQSIPELIKSIPKLVGKIINAFKNGMSLKDIGINLIKGLWNGIKSVKEWLLSKISGFVSGAIKGIKSFFGIKSPSKVMAKEVGQWLPKGIAVGIDANADSVYSAMKNLDKEISSTFQLSPQVTNSTALNNSPSVNVNVYSTYNQDPLGQMVRSVKTFSGGAKNDYNYGMGV